MTNFNYKPIYPTRKMTEENLLAIDREMHGIIEDGDVFHAVDKKGIGHGMYMHLGKLAETLKADLKYFDAIDAAMEQAVK